MTTNRLAHDDFERAITKGFWRNILSLLTGADNKLLPFDEIKQHIPIRGQHYAGMMQVEIDQIVGSLGRYYDFDRAFLPLQRRTKHRWVSIDQAHYAQVPLPPIELFKVGEIYFVKDGNHRVSVARERGQEFIDAYVIEIETSVNLTPETSVGELDLLKAASEFMEQTRLNELRPGSSLEVTQPGLYDEILRHIEVHRWYLGEQRAAEVPYDEAVTSWYDNVYQPLIDEIREQNLEKEFPGIGEADLYLWVMEYQGFLRRAYRYENDADRNPREEAAKQLMAGYPVPIVKKLIAILSRTDWLEKMLLKQEQAEFVDQTGILEIRPKANIETTQLGQYEQIREHILAHRWYLGEQQGKEASYEEAVASWYDRVYRPLVVIIREQRILNDFPGRTETDLYLWIIRHQWYLRETYGDTPPLEEVAERFTGEHSQNPVKKVVKTIKKVTGME